MTAPARNPNPSADDMLRRTGIFYGLPYSEYERLAGLRKTSMWTFCRKTPAHYQQSMLESDDETDALRLGSATHTIVWEPDQFERRYIVSPPPPPIPSRPEVTKWNRTYKEHKAAWADITNAAAAAGRTILDNEEYDRCRRMRDKLHAHPMASRLIRLAKPEVSMQWMDADSGLLVKGRLDGLCPDALVYMDLKTAITAEPVAFSRHGYDLGYHFQMALYFDGLATLTKETKRVPAMPVLIVVENTPPYEVACIEMSEDDLAIGRAQYQWTLGRIKECQASGQWPGYNPGLLPFVMPAYAGRELSAAAME
jgi:exodeoxyribonuclease VIII